MSLLNRLIFSFGRFCEKDGRANPLLWRCGAKATAKIGSGQPDRRLLKCSKET